MAWAVIFIVVFGIALLVPVVWAIVGMAQGRTQRFWPTILGMGFALALMLVTFVGMASDWGGCDADTDVGAVKCGECAADVWAKSCGKDESCGATDPGQYCPSGVRPTFVFCEAFVEGSVKQPAATWSDLCFIAVGLWLLWLLPLITSRRGSSAPFPLSLIPSDASNPMLGVGGLSLAYALIIIFMGPPSMWFHASIKNWGGWFDSLSVVIWLGFNAFYVAYTLIFAMWGNGRGLPRTITVGVALAVAVAVFAAVGWVEPEARLFGYVISGGLWGTFEVIYAIVAAKSTTLTHRRAYWMFPVNAGILALTMGIWVLYNDGVIPAELCHDLEAFPGHGLFHILASVSTLWTFFDFASERPVNQRNDRLGPGYSGRGNV